MHDRYTWRAGAPVQAKKDRYFLAAGGLVPRWQHLLQQIAFEPRGFVLALADHSLDARNPPRHLGQAAVWLGPVRADATSEINRAPYIQDTLASIAEAVHARRVGQLRHHGPG